MTSDDRTTLLLEALAWVFIGGPIAWLTFGLWMRSRDRKYLAGMPIEDLWKQTGLTAEQREHFTMFAFYHRFLSTRWELLQDGREAGYFESTQLGQANFYSPALDANSWVGSQKSSEPGTLSHIIHLHNGGEACITYSSWSSSYTIVEGQDTYTISIGGNVSYVMRNDETVAVCFRAGIAARVVAIDKNVPDSIKGLICSMSTQTRL